MIKGKIEIFKDFGTPEQELVQVGDNLVVDGLGEVIADILTLSPSLSANTDSSSILDASNFTVQALSFGKSSDAYKENAHKPGEMPPNPTSPYRDRHTNRENLLKSDDFVGLGWNNDSPIVIENDVIDGPLPGTKGHLITNTARGNNKVKYLSYPIEKTGSDEEFMDSWSNTIHDTSSHYLCWSCFFKINPIDPPDSDGNMVTTDMKIAFDGTYPPDPVASGVDYQIHSVLRWDLSKKEASGVIGTAWWNIRDRGNWNNNYTGQNLVHDASLYVEKYDNGWYRSVVAQPLPPEPSGISVHFWPTGYSTPTGPNAQPQLRGSIYAACPQLEIGRFATEWKPPKVYSPNIHPYPNDMGSWYSPSATYYASSILDYTVATNPFGGGGVVQIQQLSSVQEDDVYKEASFNHVMSYSGTPEDTFILNDYYTFSIYVSGVDGLGSNSVSGNECAVHAHIYGTNPESIEDGRPDGIPGSRILNTKVDLRVGTDAGTLKGSFTPVYHPRIFNDPYLPTTKVEAFSNNWYRVSVVIKAAEKGPRYSNDQSTPQQFYGELPLRMVFGVVADNYSMGDNEDDNGYIPGDYSYLNIWGAKIEPGTQATPIFEEFNNFDFSGTIRDGITRVIPLDSADAGVLSEDQLGNAPTPNDTTLAPTSESDIEEDMGLDIQNGQLLNVLPFRDGVTILGTDRMGLFSLKNRKREYVPHKGAAYGWSLYQHPLDNYANLIGCFPDASGTSTPTTVHFVSSLETSSALESPDQVYTFSSLFNTVSSMDFRGFLRAYHMDDETDPASGLIVSSLDSLSSTGKVKYHTTFASGDRGYSTMFGGVHDLGLWVPDFRKAHDFGYTPPFNFHPIDNEFDYKLIAHKNLTDNLGHTAGGDAIAGDAFEDLTIIWTLSFLEQ